jgi:hypothetical protein
MQMRDTGCEMRDSGFAAIFIATAIKKIPPSAGLFKLY